MEFSHYSGNGKKKQRDYDIIRSSQSRSGREGTGSTHIRDFSYARTDAPVRSSLDMVQELTKRAESLTTVDRTSRHDVEEVLHQAQELRKQLPGQIETKVYKYIQTMDQFHDKHQFEGRTLDEASAETDKRIAQLQQGPFANLQREIYRTHKGQLEATAQAVNLYEKALHAKRTQIRQHLDEVETTLYTLEPWSARVSDEVSLLNNYHRQLSHEYRLVDKELTLIQCYQSTSGSKIYDYIPKKLLQKKASLRGFSPHKAYGDGVCVPTCITLLESMYLGNESLAQRFDVLYKQFFSGIYAKEGLDFKEAAYVLDEMKLPIKDASGKKVKFKPIYETINKAQLESFLEIRDSDGQAIPIIMHVEGEISNDHYKVNEDPHAILVRRSVGSGYDIWDPYEGFHVKTLDPLFHAAQMNKVEEGFDTDHKGKRIPRTYQYRPLPESTMQKVTLTEPGPDGRRVPVYEVFKKEDQAGNTIPVFVTDTDQRPLKDFSGKPIQETVVELIVPYFSD